MVPPLPTRKRAPPWIYEGPPAWYTRGPSPSASHTCPSGADAVHPTRGSLSLSCGHAALCVMGDRGNRGDVCTAAVNVRPLGSCDRAACARLYARLQHGVNPMFAALGASHEHLEAYGGVLYDHCVAYESLAAVEAGDGERVVGIYLVMDAQALCAVEPSPAMGPARVHLAFCKHMYACLKKKWAARGVHRPKALYSVFAGVRPDLEGRGVFAKLHRTAMSGACRGDAAYTLGWGFSLSQSAMLKRFESKSPVPKRHIQDRLKNRPILAALDSLITRAVQWNVVNSPAWAQRVFSEALNCARPARLVFIAYDTRRFVCEGKQPLKDYLISWCGSFDPRAFDAVVRKEEARAATHERQAKL